MDFAFLFNPHSHVCASKTIFLPQKVFLWKLELFTNDDANLTVVCSQLNDKTVTMIELTLVQGNGFVFRAGDARVLREEHRIVGSLVGCLPAHPHQNIHLGLPLQLSKEEVTLLLELGLAQFKKKNNFPGEKNSMYMEKQC